MTSITDQSTATVSDNTTIYAGEGVTAAVVVDGFTVAGGGGTVSSAIRTVYASPVIRNNICSGGTGTNTYALWVGGYYPIIQHNTIRGGNAASNSYGINAVDGYSGTIEKNVIDGGIAGNYACGIYTTGGTIRNNTVTGGSGQHSATGIAAYGTAAIKNNTINGGSGLYYSTGITMGGAFEAVEIENNAIFTTGAYYRVCIMEDGNPAKVHNNDLFGCPTALYVNFVSSGGNCSFWNNGNCLTIIAEVNSLTDISGGSSDNISVDPVFADQAGGDWHLTDMSPVAVAQGGLDLSASFTDDKDGNTRTIPWSMGAYERD